MEEYAFEPGPETAMEQAQRAMSVATRLSDAQRLAVAGARRTGDCYTLPAPPMRVTRLALQRAQVLDNPRDSGIPLSLTSFGLLVRAVVLHGPDAMLVQAERADADRPQAPHVRELAEAGAAVLAARAELDEIRAEEQRLADRKRAALGAEREALGRRGRAIRDGVAHGMEPDDIATEAQMSRTKVYDWIDENRSRVPGAPKRPQDS